uniref:Uncharacterized protein n=1 Tax=Romanomermis culicivorax TaxID=13658 RepID=A0A915KMG1_ROMCU
MESSAILQSFVNPSSPTGERFDLLVNHHLTTHATFHEFDPFESGYIMGFLVAILCSIANSGPSFGPQSGGIKVDDILIKVSGINEGISSLTITSQDDLKRAKCRQL